MEVLDAGASRLATSCWREGAPFKGSSKREGGLADRSSKKVESVGDGWCREGCAVESARREECASGVLGADVDSVSVEERRTAELRTCATAVERPAVPKSSAAGAAVTLQPGASG